MAADALAPCIARSSRATILTWWIGDVFVLLDEQSAKHYFDGWVQERHNSIALAMELHLSCTNPWIWRTSINMAPYIVVVFPALLGPFCMWPCVDSSHCMCLVHHAGIKQMAQGCTKSLVATDGTWLPSLRMWPGKTPHPCCTNGNANIPIGMVSSFQF